MRKRAKSLLKKLTKPLIKLVAIGFVLSILMLLYIAKDLPDLTKFNERNITESTKIYDRTGTVLLYDLHGEEKRTVIPFDQMPESIKKATIAAEDANFYKHHGVDIKGILRAVWVNIRGGGISQGGSTITQQFIKQSIVGDQRTILRKIKEAILAIELEFKYSKDEILGFYLNQIPYGSNAYGIESTSLTFFDKPAKDLTIAESALIAGLTKAPTYYSPYGSHPEDLNNRKNYILDRMNTLGLITQEELEQAKNEKLTYNTFKQNIKAPHFVMYVREYLEQKYGQETLERSGLKVYTTLDWTLQKKAEEVIAKYIEQNEKKYNAGNAALAASDPKTGQILVMVGSRDYFDIEHDGNVNITIRDRQPGSSFKPYVYAEALIKGYTPETMLFDLKTNFGTPNSDQYTPKNYDNQFRGPISMRKSLAQSLNIPSVKLLYLSGMNDVINLAQDIGITTLKDRSRYGLSLVLGGGEVKLIDMVSAYGVFANDGVKYPQSVILKIENPQEQIMEEWKDTPEKILEPRIARQISNILSDAEARVPAISLGSRLELKGRPVAAKTGTTQEARDGWTVGYTPQLSVGVWTGNNDNTPMVGTAAGYYTAAPIWHDFFAEAVKDLPVENFIEPEITTVNKTPLNGDFINNRIQKYNKYTGELADENTPPDLIEERSYPEVHSILYYIAKEDPQGDAPADPSLDSQFNNWEIPVLDWVYEQGLNGTIYNQPLPKNNQPQIIYQPLNITITNLSDGQVVYGLINLNINIDQPQNINQIDYFFDDYLIASKKQPTFNLTFKPEQNTKNGYHNIIIKAYSISGQKTERKVIFYWQSQ